MKMSALVWKLRIVGILHCSAYQRQNVLDTTSFLWAPPAEALEAAIVRLAK